MYISVSKGALFASLAFSAWVGTLGPATSADLGPQPREPLVEPAPPPSQWQFSFTSSATSAVKEFGRDGRPENPLALHFFTEVLGDVAGNLTLATGAWGGVFFCGGVIDAWIEQADHDRFRTRFESKGAMTTRMRRVFTGVITKPNIALFGLAGLSL
jgi:hypothetical protein